MADLTPTNYWPLGSTVQKTFAETPPSTMYRHFGFISVNPINGNMVLFYRKGDKHVGEGDYGKICMRSSSNGGTTWSLLSLEELFSETNVDLRNLGGGYDSNGRLFLFYARYYPGQTSPYIAAQWYSMNYRYSNDNGTSWSNQQTLSNMSNPAYSPHGHIIDIGNNTLFQTWYAVNGSTYSLYLYKSTDGGASFSSVKTIYSGTNLYTELSMANLGGGCFLVLARINSGSCFNQFKSENYCENWTNQGNTSFETWSTAEFLQAPPFLSFINYEGVGIVACYYSRRDSNPRKLKVVFGLAKDLLDNGPSGWNASTIKVFDKNYTVGDRNGYQSFFHPQNQFKGIGVCFEANTNSLAYPVIEFTNISGLSSILTTLGL